MFLKYVVPLLAESSAEIKFILLINIKMHYCCSMGNSMTMVFSVYLQVEELKSKRKKLAIVHVLMSHCS